MDKKVYSGQVNGMDIEIRYPKVSDAEAMCRYMNELSQEKTYVTWQGEEITLEYETEYLNKQIEKINNKETIKLILLVNGDFAGITDITPHKKVNSHVATFGISIAKRYRGKGLGKLLMEKILIEAKRLSEIKIITLEVFAENQNAIKLYKKLGFNEYGRLPKGIKYKRRYIDNVLMYKEL